MSRRCPVTGKGVQTGNNVSHAHNKTRRRFLPNLQNTAVYSDALARTIRLRLAANALRTIEKAGGLDSFLLGTKDSDLAPEIRRIKKRVRRAHERAAA